MKKIIKFIMLIALTFSFGIGYATVNLPFILTPGTDPDPIEGYGLPMTVMMYVSNSGPSVTLDANLLWVDINVPPGMEISSIAPATIPAGFEFVFYDESYAYFVNTVPVTVTEDGLEFFVTVTPTAALSGTMILSVLTNPEYEGTDDYDIPMEDGETVHTLGITVPDVDLNEPLNVDFIAVNAQSNADCGVNLAWAVSSQNLNGITFAIERSADGITFNEVARIAGENGHSKMAYTDRQPLSGDNVYRIVQVGVDGKTTHSKNVKAIVSCNEQVITMYPNPATSFVTLNGLSNGQEIRVFSVTGTELLTKITESQSEVIHLNDLPAGVYSIVISEGGNKIFTGNLVKK